MNCCGWEKYKTKSGLVIGLKNGSYILYPLRYTEKEFSDHFKSTCNICKKVYVWGKELFKKYT